VTPALVKFRAMLDEYAPDWFDPAEPIPGDPFVSFIVHCPCGHKWGECQKIGHRGLKCSECGEEDKHAVWASFEDIYTARFILEKPQPYEEDEEDD